MRKPFEYMRDKKMHEVSLHPNLNPPVFTLSVLEAGIRLVVLIFLCRYLGPLNLGLYMFLYVLAKFIPPVLGLEERGITGRMEPGFREIAGSSSAFSFRIGLPITFGLFMILLAAMLSGYLEKTVGLLFVACMADTFFQKQVQFQKRTGFLAGRMDRIVFYSVADNVLLLIAVLSGMYYRLELLPIAWLMALRGVPVFLTGILILSGGRDLPSEYRFFSDPGRRPRSVKNNILFLVSCSGMILLNVDVLFLKLLKGYQEISYFQAVHLMIILLSLIPASLSASFSPYLRILLKDDRQRATHFIDLVLKFLLCMSLPLAVVLWAFAPGLVNLFFGEAYHSSSVMMALSFTLILLSLLSFIFPLSILFQERKPLVPLLTALMVRVLLDIMFIPAFDAFGAALAATASYFIYLLLLVQAIRREGVKIFNAQVWDKPLISAFFMAVIVCLGTGLGSFTFLLIGSAFYLNMIFLWRVFSSTDIQILKEIKF